MQAALTMADMLDSDAPHHIVHNDCKPSNVRVSERAVKRTTRAFESLLNPFDCDDPILRSVASGAAIADEIADSMLGAEKIGNAAADAFVVSRFVDKDGDIFELIKRIKILGVQKKTVVLKTSANKLVEMKQQGSVTLQLLAKCEGEETLREFMKYPLLPVPPSLGTPDGFLAKSNKSTGMNYITKNMFSEEVLNASAEVMYVEDGNALFYCIKTQKTFGDISRTLFSMATKRDNVIFSTDSYEPQSVKSQERLRRGAGERRIIKGSSTRCPESWSSFLENDGNKVQLIDLLQKCWTESTTAKNVILVNAGKAFKMK